MKTLTNKLVLSVLALVLTGVALSVGVFAWFTINNQANVQAFTGTVQTGEGFYVSLDGSTWQNTLTSGEMQAAAGNITFVPLTSIDGVAITDMAGVAAAVTGYIEFDLLFAGSTNLGGVQLDVLELASSTTQWVPGVDVAGTRSEGAPNAPIVEYVSNAARVSFQDLGTAAIVSVYEQAENKAASTSAADLTPNGNSLGFGTYATNEAILFYNAIMDTDLVEASFDTALAADPTAFTAGSGLNREVAELYPFAATFAGYNINVDSIAATITAAPKIGAITVRVWVEGWDQEALNAILSGVLTVNFNFSAIA